MADIRYPELVEYDTGTWAMVYINANGANMVVDYATSEKTDPHNWTKAAADNPILTVAGGDIRGVAVVKAQNTYHLLYDTVGQFCYAYGPAPNNLTKYSATDVPVFEGQGTDWEEYVRHPALIRLGQTFHLFYDGRDNNPLGIDGAIGHATSTNMVTWTRDEAHNPLVDVGTDAWEVGDVGAPTILVQDGIFYLYYMGFGAGVHQIGVARARQVSGPYTKSLFNPIIEIGGLGEWDEINVTGPCAFAESGNVHVYYSGVDAGGNQAIGYATRD